MTTLKTVYVETPWGIFTQQQVVLNMAFAAWVKSNALTINSSPSACVTYASDFYNTAWPLIEALNL